ncbi:effector-associated constant component EACC1 [Yinghuangia sp. YIM S09857]|uniref:effector-associated constant component EACC1 n=1 Tax=Yinghuangia sp. YIM S09857 TaxID=3436929 RepID=UPI003F537BC2
MHVTITLDGADARDDVRHLYRWLRDADQLRYDARVELTSSQDTLGESLMGPTLDVIDIVLASGFSAASLAATLAMWRSSRPRAGSATLTVGATTVTVQDGSPETIRAIVDALTANAGPVAEAVSGPLSGAAPGAGAAPGPSSGAAPGPTPGLTPGPTPVAAPGSAPGPGPAPGAGPAPGLAAAAAAAAPPATPPADGDGDAEGAA